MGTLRQIITPLHQRTPREYLPRMVDDKVEAMEVALRYGREYWDGDRRYGYGGYRYDGRWRPVAEKLIETYELGENARVLDVGCGKAHLLHELRQLLPRAEVVGFDVSEHALATAKEEVRDRLFRQRAQDLYPFADQHFDLVISLNTLHNLRVNELKTALGEMQRCGRRGYLVVESFRNSRELFNLQCWALTCASFHTPEEWIWLFDEFGYGGDYEFIYFE